MGSNLNCFLDAEWGSDGKPISLQVLLEMEGVPSRAYCIIDSKYSDDLQCRGVYSGYNVDRNVFFVFRSFSDKELNPTFKI